MVMVSSEAFHCSWAIMEGNVSSSTFFTSSTRTDKPDDEKFRQFQALRSLKMSSGLVRGKAKYYIWLDRHLCWCGGRLKRTRGGYTPRKGQMFAMIDSILFIEIKLVKNRLYFDKFGYVGMYLQIFFTICSIVFSLVTALASKNAFSSSWVSRSLATLFCPSLLRSAQEARWLSSSKFEPVKL